MPKLNPADTLKAAKHAIPRKFDKDPNANASKGPFVPKTNPNAGAVLPKNKALNDVRK